MNRSSPTKTGKFGRKQTEPTVKARLPIRVQNERNAPIFCKGLSRLNSG